MAVAVIVKIRLDKFLADMRYGTRSEAKREIARGNVKINGVPVRKPETKIDTEKDEVAYKDQPAVYEKYEYYMLNKPAGVISATTDKKEKTVLDLIEEKQRKDLFPVGRLDRDTEGLLLITNDGELAHRLLSPKKHVDKIYYVRVQGSLSEEDIRRLAEGIDIGDEKPTLPAQLVILKSGQTSEAEITIQEGKFHQVKRMFHALGKEVVYLKRLRMGTLVLDENLKPGEYRKLTKEERDGLC